MKKLVISALVIGLFSIGLSSCGTYKERTNRTSGAFYTPSMLQPKVVDYTVNLQTKATGTAEGKLAGKLSFKKWLTKDYYIEAATGEAIISSGSDFLWEPVVETQIKRKEIKVTVTGYPAKYTEISKLNINDSVQVKFYQKQQLLGPNGVKENRKSGGSGFLKKLFGK